MAIAYTKQVEMNARQPSFSRSFSSEKRKFWKGDEGKMANQAHWQR